ncbi:hypothetical protein CLOP_g16639 [Closterium sp. NIES-67]|nr:hypothetical protein CLOP_g16639 [Closterium sp. NIES-67]
MSGGDLDSDESAARDFFSRDGKGFPTAGPSPELSASWPSFLFWSWIAPFMHYGYRKVVQEDDLYDLNPVESTRHSVDCWDQAWRTELEREKRDAEKMRLRQGCEEEGTTSGGRGVGRVWRVLVRAFGRYYFVAAIWKPIWLAAVCTQVYVLKQLVGAAAAPEPPAAWRAALLVVGMALTSVLQSVCMHHCFTRSQKAGMRVRACVCTVVYHKALRMKQVALGEATSGRMLNLITNDTQKLLDAITYFHYVWLAVLDLTVICALVIVEAGVAALGGVAVVFLIQPLIVWMAKRVAALRPKALKFTDARVRLLGEVLSGMRVVKVNGWTAAFLDRIRALRDNELQWLRRAAYVRSVNSTLKDSVTPLASLATFGIYVAIHGDLPPQTAFAVLALFSIMVRIFFIAPTGLQFAGEAVVAVDRLEKFLALPEGQGGCLEEKRLELKAEVEPEGIVVALQDVSFSWKLPSSDQKEAAGGEKRQGARGLWRKRVLARKWGRAGGEEGGSRVEDTGKEETNGDEATGDVQPECMQGVGKEGDQGGVLNDPQEPAAAAAAARAGFCLQRVCLRVERGAVVAVTGAVGSGKSSLLQAILEEMQYVDGAMYVSSRGHVAYAAQQPWILNATVMENILFGQPFDAGRYQEVVRACALERDIAALAAGHQTEIGERGINLSGGQKARISLARACYSSAPLVLLDDPLAAVDVPTAKHLIENVLQGGVMQRGNRTVVLVTHNRRSLDACSQVLLMTHGRLGLAGSEEELAEVGAISGRTMARVQSIEAMAAAAVEAVPSARYERGGAWGSGENLGGWKGKSVGEVLVGEEGEGEEEAVGTGAGREVIQGEGVTGGERDGVIAGKDERVSTESRSDGLDAVAPSQAEAVGRGREGGAHEGAEALVEDTRRGEVKEMQETQETEDAQEAQNGAVRQGGVGVAHGPEAPQKQTEDETSQGQDGAMGEGVTETGGVVAQGGNGALCPGEDGVGHGLKAATTENGALCRGEDGALRSVRWTEGQMAKRAQWGQSSTGRVTIKEDRVEGRVTRATYSAYIRAGGGFLLFAALLLAFIGAQAVRTYVDFWLGVWVDRKYSLSPGMYVGLYAVFTAGAILLSLLRAFWFTQAALAAARHMHHHMAVCVLRSPLLFFDQNPVGRILNRFSKDQSLVDDLLPTTVQQTLELFLGCAGAIAVTAVLVPWFLLALPPLLLLFFLLQQRYLRVSRELKRIDGLSRSPIYAHFSQSLQGVVSVRAYGAAHAFLQHFVALIDANHRAYIQFVHAGRWLGIRLDLCASALVTLVAILVVVLHGSLPAGYAGVILVQCLQLTGLFQYAIRQAAESENYFTSVERIHAFMQLPPEANHLSPPGALPPDWPQKGRIEFRHVCMAYREDLPYALNDLTFTVNGGEMVGILGRTGSGKSSLAAVLFRLVENSRSRGHVSIDGLDLRDVGLDDLRQRLSIIPQDPVLFQGCVRQNLDPFGRYSDADMVDALRRAHLAPSSHATPSAAAAAGAVETPPALGSGKADEECRTNGAGDGNAGEHDSSALLNGSPPDAASAAATRLRPVTLDMEVSENGENFSVGQRQLLCLARALLRQSRVVVLDEATAAVDGETDALVQATVREQFGVNGMRATVLTIAHRIDTVIDADRVLVLAPGGRVAEFDTPAHLLRQGLDERGMRRGEGGSVFASMVENAGVVVAAKLYGAAMEAESRNMQNRE